MEREVLDLFKVMVTPSKEPKIQMDMIDYGVVTDFVPTREQSYILMEYFKPLPITTLFTREERDNADPIELITIQLLHYLEVYGLNSPGLFNLEMTSGSIVTMNYVRGVTVEELGDMVRKLLYTNAPVKDSENLVKIISHYNISYEINNVANNELRVLLFNPKKDTFALGDDVVRYVCWLATNSALLIKSKEVIQSVNAISVNISEDFLTRHETQLAKVFNRHKRLIMALKNPSTRTVINRISRYSKVLHQPIKTHISKEFINYALKGTINVESVLSKLGVRDKFKYLNLLAYKRKKSSNDIFVIRNGKAHFEPNRKVWDDQDIDRVEKAVIASLKKDLEFLNKTKILLDEKVHYGLPISRKQTIGNLPFGTVVHVNGPISSGMYWENSWGANDLDLSTINENGDRIGWGMYSGYDNKNPVIFSGDITSAPRGAMEFMTSTGQHYGLFVNIYSGLIGAGMELVVGEASDDEWITDVVIREKHALKSTGNIIGFVQGDKYVVFAGRLGGGRYSSGNAKSKAAVAYGMADRWTLNRLFDELGIKYHTKPEKDVYYDHDLSYTNMSYDKLESLLAL